MKDIVNKQKNDIAIGICSVCSAHPLVIEAALRFYLHSEQKVLIESTSNQVNQFGGYTGMLPNDFRYFVFKIAEKIGFPYQRIILGGDHLGPNCWQHESSEQAMLKAEVLIAEYVKAGFTKIHLDTSMSCADDPVALSPDTVASRSARLCLAAEQAATAEQKQHLTYVIGTEVPVPGGEASAINQVHVTTVSDTDYTISSHYKAFSALGLTDAIQRIIAVVVQPGVEFDHSQVIHYQPQAAKELSQFIQSTPLIYEAHSTDYQTDDSLKALVRDHFAILKVGPALTFALREAIFALAHIENVLIEPEKCSYAATVLRQVMLDNPQYWQKYYPPKFSHLLIDIDFSLSDRSRYYWPNPRLNDSVNQLIDNLAAVDLPLGLLSQYLPKQFQRVLEGTIQPHPQALIIDKIQDVIRSYDYACQ